MSDNKELRLITPVGKAEWLHIVKPDTKFDQMGKYKLNMYLTKEDLEALCTPLRPLLEEAVAMFQAEEDEKAKKAGKRPKPVKVSDSQVWNADEMEDGTFLVKLARKASFTDKDGVVQEIKLPVLDGAGNRIPPEVLANERYGNGTVVRCVVTARPYNMATTGVGISLRLEKVQILKKVEYQSGADNEMGAYEGADYVSPNVPAASQEPDITGDEPNYTV